MNDFQKLIQDHVSVRKFKDIEIDNQTLNDILTCGIRAASSGNMQFYSIVVSRDKKQKELLYRAHRKQEMVLQAPVVLSFCADQNRISQWMKSNKAPYEGNNSIGFLRGIIDVCLVAQNVALAAESKGLGICYMGSTLMNCDKIVEILELPKSVFPVTSMVLGYPNEKPNIVPRLELHSVIHNEKYQNYDTDRLQKIYSEREKATWERFKNQDAYLNKINSGEIKTACQIYTEGKYSKEKLSLYSATIDNLLKNHWY